MRYLTGTRNVGAGLLSVAPLAVLLAAVCPVAGAQNVRAARQTLRLLTTAHAVHSLTHEQAARAYPVRLHAVVTYFDPYTDARMGDLFVHDSTGCIFVKLPHEPILNLQAGDVVEVVGVSGPGDFAPIVDHPQVKLIGKSQVPATAPKVTFEQLLLGRLDGQWVQFEGLVHAAHVTANNAVLDISTPGGSLAATTRREAGVNYDELVDAEIQLHANAAPVFNWKLQMVGVHLFFPSLRQIQVLQSPPPDPFKQPVLPIADLLTFKPGKQLDHRIRVQGTVTLYWPGNLLCIQQKSQTLCTKSSQPDRVAPGDLVDVVGFLAIIAYQPTLEDAKFRRVASGIAQPHAVPVTADEALSGRREGEFVSLDGEMVGRAQASGGLELMIRSGGILVPALLPKQLADRDPSAWKEGSILRVSGICLGTAGPDIWALREGQIQPGAVHILLRSMDDIQLLQAPSWWTPEHTWKSFAAICAMILGAFAWIVILRHSVKQRTHALRASQDQLRHLSKHDALTGLANRILLNDRIHTALKRAKQSESHLGLLMLDLDGFKAVNDKLGHQAGDILLCEMAGRLVRCVRMTDTVARIGGDEFIVLLPDLHDAAETQSIASKIVAATADPFLIDQTTASITVSIGVVTYPEGGLDPQTLLRCADEAMYAAKKRGKNGFQIYLPTLANRSEDRQALRQVQSIPASASGTRSQRD